MHQVSTTRFVSTSITQPSLFRGRVTKIHQSEVQYFQVFSQMIRATTLKRRVVLRLTSLRINLHVKYWIVSLDVLFDLWALSVSACNKSLIIKVSLIGAVSAVLEEYKSLVFIVLNYDRTVSTSGQYLHGPCVFSSQKYGSAFGCF